ncbi:unnamed protein product [Linum tenue]|uniref:Uncharacterized protein n=1 Tax=Linum tenue TaxID=586396 RepID=A0AAV0HE28_9ROSI|nr:unnamed protein product [Linum tenue]
MSFMPLNEMKIFLALEQRGTVNQLKSEMEKLQGEIRAHLALILRSNELKLEMELENSHAEIASSKKKISNLERERLDLHSTIDALREEKKLLLSKLRKSSTSGKSIDAGKSTTVKRDMLTSTEDLEVFPDASDQETFDAASLPGSNVPISSVSPEIGQPNDGISSPSIPADQ